MRFFYDTESRLDILADPNGIGHNRWYDDDARLRFRRVQSSSATFPDQLVRFDSVGSCETDWVSVH